MRLMVYFADLIFVLRATAAGGDLARRLEEREAEA